jgi:hypothetical protein
VLYIVFEASVSVKCTTRLIFMCDYTLLKTRVISYLSSDSFKIYNEIFNCVFVVEV